VLDQLEQIARWERRMDRLLPPVQPAADAFPERLADFIPAISQQYEPPLHLGPYLDVVESTLHQPRKVVLSVPPRHAKTDTTLHSFPYLWSFEPGKTHGYFSYSADITAEKSQLAQRYTEATGKRVSGTIARWYNGAGGGLIAGGIQGAITGRGIDGVAVVDDPHKNRAEAESPTHRKRIYEGFKSDVLTRLEPGASVIVIQTRWHPDDLAGRLIKEGWPDLVISLPAVQNDTVTGRDDDHVRMAYGAALWPGRWPLEALERKRREVGEFAWASLFQGLPRPRGSTLFGEASYYSALPREGYRVTYGVDLAYTAKTSADWTICVRLCLVGRSHQTRGYVQHVDRLQVEAPQSGAVLKRRQSEMSGPMWWHGAGPEKGSAQLFNAHYLDGKMVLKTTTLDKFTRALDSSEAWNDGRILVPRQAPWLQPFLGVVQGFTGVGDDYDDDVDALGSGWAAGQSAPGSYSKFRRHKGPPPRI
jgi:hypothetical protein